MRVLKCFSNVYRLKRINRFAEVVIYTKFYYVLDPTPRNRRQQKMIARKWLLRGHCFKKYTNLFIFLFSQLPRKLKAKVTMKQRY